MVNNKTRLLVPEFDSLQATCTSPIATPAAVQSDGQPVWGTTQKFVFHVVDGVEAAIARDHALSGGGHSFEEIAILFLCVKLH